MPQQIDLPRNSGQVIVDPVSILPFVPLLLLQLRNEIEAPADELPRGQFLLRLLNGSITELVSYAVPPPLVCAPL